MIIAFAQGMALLRIASEAYEFGLDLSEVAKIWRGGCIIRAALLGKIRQAYTDNPSLPNLLLDPQLAQEVREREADLRSIICNASRVGLPAPGLMASLSYLDSYRSGWLPANLIQAQRDYFGAHTYKRVDAQGAFHTQWSWL
jgi:6-phosphogluconate dehydrogenase